MVSVPVTVSCVLYVCVVGLHLAQPAAVYQDNQRNPNPIHHQQQVPQVSFHLTQRRHRHRHNHRSGLQGDQPRPGHSVLPGQSILPDPGHSATPGPSVPCPPGQFLLTQEGGVTRCTACSQCPAGFGVKARCEARRDTVCERCVTGTTYLRDYFGVPKCLPCKACDNRVIVRECTATKNRQCGSCKPGYFFDDMTNTCLQCSYCYPEVPGYGVVEPMCQGRDQPPEMTCLPSLPPAGVRAPGVTTAAPTIDETLASTIDNRLKHLDDKLRRIGRTVDGEIAEARRELVNLRTALQDRRAL